ncbi:hypothetical protein B0F90DRAFT_1820064 [Multifurca ochricompacta]|uniref:2-oxoglutarate dehydrogenase E1 component/KDG C-terminal domain-containing protein n=1 Tax=Multifurca ochricompacta TaxID=376703 RepID=A0AAD4LZ66_9AGAM|nr:hypothetical protein B0F90DRAFT_1820064 [Multifurca ochricompacta]
MHVPTRAARSELVEARIAERVVFVSADALLVRIKELCPFPFEELREVLGGATAGEVFWVQEEPRNQGAWPHVALRVGHILEKPLVYYGRHGDAVPAPGVGKLYRAQQEVVIKGAFEGLGS